MYKYLLISFALLLNACAPVKVSECDPSIDSFILWTRCQNGGYVQHAEAWQRSLSDARIDEQGAKEQNMRLRTLEQEKRNQLALLRVQVNDLHNEMVRMESIMANFEKGYVTLQSDRQALANQFQALAVRVQDLISRAEAVDRARQAVKNGDSGNYRPSQGIQNLKSEGRTFSERLLGFAKDMLLPGWSSLFKPKTFLHQFFKFYGLCDAIYSNFLTD